MAVKNRADTSHKNDTLKRFESNIQKDCAGQTKTKTNEPFLICHLDFSWTFRSSASLYAIPVRDTP